MTIRPTQLQYPLYEYYRREELRLRTGLPADYRFTQCDEDEDIIAMHDTTGQKIVWNGTYWVDYDQGDSPC